jgi:hypothetical protein
MHPKPVVSTGSTTGFTIYQAPFTLGFVALRGFDRLTHLRAGAQPRGLPFTMHPKPVVSTGSTTGFTLYLLPFILNQSPFNTFNLKSTCQRFVTGRCTSNHQCRGSMFYLLNH